MELKKSLVTYKDVAEGSKMDWLGLESDIRTVLEARKDGEIGPSNALFHISSILGHYTGRGYPAS